MKIRLIPHQFYIVVGLILFANLIMLAGTRLFHYYYYDILAGNWEQASSTKYALLELSLGTENTIATWYSSMLFLGVAIFSLLNFLLEKERSLQEKNGFLNYGWLIFFFLFSILSFDEIASMHERIGELDEINPVEDKTYGWISILALPILAVGIYMLYFLFKKIRISRWASYFAFFGILLFLSVPLHEFIELKAWNKAPDMETWKRPAHFLLLEEGSELFGVTAMFIAVLIFGINTVNRSNRFPIKPFIEQSLNIKRKDCLLLMLSLFSFLLILMILLTQSELLAAEGDIGRIRNWFPAAAAMLSFLLVLCLIPGKYNFSRFTKSLHIGYASFFLFLSAYYGGNLYVHFANLSGNPLKILLMILFCLLAIAVGISHYRTFGNPIRKTGALIWTILIVASLLMSNNYSAGLAFIGFSILVLCLIDHYFSIRTPEKNREETGSSMTGQISSVAEIRNRRI